MQRSTRAIAMLGISALALTGLVTAQSTKQIKFVGFAGSQGGFETRAKEFMKTHPDIQVKVEGVPATSWGELLQAITVNIAGGDTPDVADIATEGMRTFAVNGVISPIDDLIAKDPAIKSLLADIHPNLIKAMKVDGKTYGLPTVWNTMVIYYNKKVLREAGADIPKEGWTITDFLKTCSQVVAKNNGGKDDKWCYSFANQYFLTIVPWMLRAGGNVLTSDWTRSRLNDPNSIAAVQLLHDFIYKYKISPRVDGGVSDTDLFIQNKLAFMGCGTWCVNSLKLAKFNSEDYDIIYFPKIKTTQNIMGVGSAPIFTATQNRAAAWEYAKFLSGKEFQQTFVVQDRWSEPSLRSAARKMEKTPGFPKNGHIFYEAASNGVLVPAPQEYGLIEATLTREFGAAMANSKSVKDAMAAAHKDISAALAKRKK